MALVINAKKGGLAVTNGYLLINMIQMQHYLRPITVSQQVPQEDGTIATVETPGVTPAVLYTARGQVYETEAARRENFGATELNFAFTFDHVNGCDAVAEAYAHIKANGLQGWTITGMGDA